ncbi:MAG: 23S rRNA (adenine(2503)-C(2))-methyltransferase RlmN [Oscillospiraceae bacterium]|jgi:23S rRNA (adenine2503-C2)-methyltransferase|nr:23S rRNA (adenine(2503)-C(2))-methyltransferase RlmN [Oscillospiraceae bacterium]
MAKIDIKSMTPDQLAESLALIGEPKFRAGQIFRWLHQRGAASFDEMSDLSKALREKCNEKYYISSINIKKKLVSTLDGTVKYLYGLGDGNTVEAVRMTYVHGNSLCVSTQVGCRMGCGFCASTMDGLVRPLTAGEMLDEVYTAQRDGAEKISSVVLMGIGEPLDNYDAVLYFLKILSDPGGFGLSLRHVSLSTCGLVDQIDILAEEALPLTLSVSLHAPNDAIRKKIMPVARKWPMDELLAACGRYFARTGRRISFEYALIDGVNDREAHARELGEKLLALKKRGAQCHVNLIPVNTVDGKSHTQSGRAAVARFEGVLSGVGIATTVRRTLGADINAACGQLRRESAG